MVSSVLTPGGEAPMTMGRGRGTPLTPHFHTLPKIFFLKIRNFLKNLELSEIMLIFAHTMDNTESIPQPAAIGSNESLALDRVGRI